MLGFAISSRVERFRAWYRKPTTRRDRATGAVVGALAFFWLGVLGRLIFGPLPVSVGVLGWWALVSVLGGLAIGIAFPKQIAVFLFPFATFGGG